MTVKDGPELSIPKSDQCCKVSIINTTCDLTVPPDFLVEPAMEGYDWMNMPTFSFYIQHEASGRQFLFDLGARKDWENHVPHIKGLITGHVPGLRISEDVLDIIVREGVELDDIEALLLSHWHFDHSGAPSKLPEHTKVVVGPGFKDAFLPGYPAREDSPFHEADFDGREVNELKFGDGFKIGQYQAHDLFNDGSLFLLNVPGHAIGHISALVRTTPDTFVFLGGDVCHHTGDIRPSQHIPLPDVIPDTAALDARLARPCACSAFLSSHHLGTEGQNQPFLRPSSGPKSFYADHATSVKSVNSLIEFDASPNILVAIAHDTAPLDVFDFFPQTMNDWKAKGWKEKSHWGFLSELPYNGTCVRPKVVDGLYDSTGSKVRGLDV